MTTPDVPNREETTTLPHDGSGAMFDRIAKRYDMVNRIISLGIDRAWRKKTVAALDLRSGESVLDIATGTADLAIEVAARTGANVTGLDPSLGMLQIGESKVSAKHLEGRIKLTRGSAEQLPFASESFDAVCMGFGIRNVPDRPTALREIFRVLRPGGRLAILELSEPGPGFLAPLARFHVHTMVPWVGSILSGAHEYRYLQRSIAAFPAPVEFAAMLERAGFNAPPPIPLTFGVVHLYPATRPA